MVMAMINLHIVGTQADVDAVYNCINYFKNNSLFNISHSEDSTHHPWMHVKIKPGHNNYEGGFTPYDPFMKFLNGYVLSKQLYDTGVTFYYNYKMSKRISNYLYAILRNQRELSRAEALIIFNIGEDIATLRAQCNFEDYYATLASARAKIVGLKPSLIVL